MATETTHHNQIPKEVTYKRKIEAIQAQAEKQFNTVIARQLEKLRGDHILPENITDNTTLPAEMAEQAMVEIWRMTYPHSSSGTKFEPNFKPYLEKHDYISVRQIRNAITQNAIEMGGHSR